MTMKDYTAAAQSAHDKLSPLLDKAVADAQARLSEADKAASAETVRAQLVAMIDNADTPPADSVTGILGSFCALLPDHRAHDGGVIIGALVSTKKRHALSEKQAAQIAGAIIASVHGKAPAGLIEWPDTWHSQLSDADLHQWVEWVAPKEYAKLSADLEATARARISAETDLTQLETCRRALADLVPSASDGTVIQIRNNADHAQGMAGIRWQAGEVLPISAADYVSLAAHGGYHRMIQQNELEVVA